MAEKYTKFYNARAEPLFCSLNLLFYHVLDAVVACLRSLIKVKVILSIESFRQSEFTSTNSGTLSRLLHGRKSFNKSKFTVWWICKIRPWWNGGFWVNLEWKKVKQLCGPKHEEITSRSRYTATLACFTVATCSRRRVDGMLNMQISSKPFPVAVLKSPSTVSFSSMTCPLGQGWRPPSRRPP